MKSNRATTLAETIIGLFLLAAGFLVILQLYHTALGFTQEGEARARAALICQNLLDQQRALTANGSYDFDEPSTFADVPPTAVAGGGLIYSVQFEPAGIQTPCSAYAGYFPDHFELTNSAQMVTVTVETLSGKPLCRASTLLTDRFRPPGSGFAIDLTSSAGGALNQGASTTLDAQASLGGVPLNDVSYNWRLATNAPGSGTLTIVPGTGLSQAEFTHRLNIAGVGVVHSNPGYATVIVEAQYRGARAVQTVRIDLL